jgi:hypothetical protein
MNITMGKFPLRRSLASPGAARECNRHFDVLSCRIVPDQIAGSLLHTCGPDLVNTQWQVAAVLL